MIFPTSSSGRMRGEKWASQESQRPHALPEWGLKVSRCRALGISPCFQIFHSLVFFPLIAPCLCSLNPHIYINIRSPSDSPMHTHLKSFPALLLKHMHLHTHAYPSSLLSAAPHHFTSCTHTWASVQHLRQQIVTDTLTKGAEWKRQQKGSLKLEKRFFLKQIIKRRIPYFPK